MSNPFSDGIYSVRKSLPEDKEFILSSWIRSHAESKFARHAGMSHYREHHIPRIEAAFADSSRAFFCAVLKDDPSIIVGWSTGRKGVIDYVYVKAASRQMGVGSTLIALFAPSFRSHETLRSLEFWKKRDIVLDPFAFTVNP
jgi:hypothetical protein